MKSQSNSQNKKPPRNESGEGAVTTSLADSQEPTAQEIISKFGLDASLWGALPDKYPKPEDPTPALLQLALSCLPVKTTEEINKNINSKGLSNTFAEGFNAAIDTMEQNILGRFS